MPDDVTPEVPAEPIQPVQLQDEMETSFLDYAMSVIMARALPDVRDGLKPVHRRIIWDMEQQGFRPDRPFVKCARVTGHTMGTFHPHGNSAIYDALVRMAQPFSLRHPLIDFHGNFGSPDFGPAAERYTECRLTPLAMRLLADIDEDTVDMVPNYDGSNEEPRVLPSRFPNLLVNGSQGIAVGMATNIPPHNLGEIIDGHHPPHRPPGRDARRFDAVRQGSRLSDWRHHPRAGRHHRRLPHRAGKREDAGGGHDRGESPRRGRDRRHRTAVPDQLLGDRRSHPGARRRRRPRRHRRCQRWIFRRSHRARHHAQARRQRQRRVEQAVQTDPAADELRDQHGRSRRRRAAHAEPDPGVARLHRPPGRRDHPPLTVPAAEGARPRAHPRGADQGARRDRRDHRPHPGERRRRGGEGGVDGGTVRVHRAPGDRHPRHAAASVDPAVADRPRDRAGGRADADPGAGGNPRRRRAGCAR